MIHSHLQKVRWWRHQMIYGFWLSPATIVRLGSGNSAWLVEVERLGRGSVVVSAGVGHDISFEKSLVDRLGCGVLLLDPSPTGRATMEKGENQRPQFDFVPMGLAGRDGVLNFDPPALPEEGSFRVAQGSAAFHWPCRSLATLARDRGWDRVDLLKIDIEGFEYEVLEDLLRNGPEVRQICVEFHHGVVPGIRKRQTLKAMGKLWWAGYDLVAHEYLNHTFIKR